jgi:hypothetical protein
MKKLLAGGLLLALVLGLSGCGESKPPQQAVDPTLFGPVRIIPAKVKPRPMHPGDVN